MCQADQPRLRSSIMRANHAAGLCGNGREVDDASPSALAHAAKDSGSDQEGLFQVDAEHFIPIGFREFLEGLDLADAGIVDKDIHWAEFVLDGFEKLVDLGGH